MKYRYEYCVNPEYVEVHVNVKIVEEPHVSRAVPPKYSPSKELFSVMQGTNGVTDVFLKPYSILANIGLVFERKEVLNNLLENLVAWLKVNQRIEKDEILIQLPDHREDIRAIKCPACQAEQNRAMKQTH